MYKEKMREIPFQSIKKKLSREIPAELLEYLPDKWEKIGTVVTIKLPNELKKYHQVIGKIYAEVLSCTSTLNDVGSISGIYREPTVEVIYGSSKTETIHMENGIRFKLDPQRIMFSSGNMGERLRMATISNNNETVVDLFSGIGYFSLPMAVYSKPKRIMACEINPLAYRYLCSNVVLNNVSDIVEPLLGDNRLQAPRDCADRVVLGYLNEPQNFLPVAFDCLRNKSGILHYHELVPLELIPEQPLAHIEKAAVSLHRSVELLNVQVIKSYAPGIIHVVLDARIFK